MGIISTIKAVKKVTKTVATTKVIASAGSTVLKEVHKGIQGAKVSSRMNELESFDHEIMFEKKNAPYIDGARLFDSQKSICLNVSAVESKGARCLRVTDSNGSNIRFTIAESRGRYKWNGDNQSTYFSITANGVRNEKLELKFGGTFWKYTLSSKGLSATESSTGYKVTNSKNEIVAETVGKLRFEHSALVYIKDSTDFNLHLAMLFTPIFFQGITAPENYSEGYEKYVNKMSSKIGLF